jgi:hypothetical protein
MLSKGTRKRLSRIKRRAVPEVQEAFSSGQEAFSSGRISARRADSLLYLAPEEQRQELARLLAAHEATEHRSRIAAEVVKSYVDAGRRDLVALERDLRLALSP